MRRKLMRSLTFAIGSGGPETETNMRDITIVIPDDVPETREDLLRYINSHLEQISTENRIDACRSDEVQVDQTQPLFVMPARSEPETLETRVYVLPELAEQLVSDGIVVPFSEGYEVVIELKEDEEEPGQFFFLAKLYCGAKVVDYATRTDLFASWALYADNDKMVYSVKVLPG